MPTPHKWNAHLHAYRLSHPSFDLKTCMQNASHTYRSCSGGTKVKRQNKSKGATYRGKGMFRRSRVSTTKACLENATAEEAKKICRKPDKLDEIIRLIEQAEIFRTKNDYCILTFGGSECEEWMTVFPMPDGTLHIIQYDGETYGTPVVVTVADNLRDILHRILQ